MSRNVTHGKMLHSVTTSSSKLFFFFTLHRVWPASTLVRIKADATSELFVCHSLLWISTRRCFVARPLIYADWKRPRTLMFPRRTGESTSVPGRPYLYWTSAQRFDSECARSLFPVDEKLIWLLLFLRHDVWFHRWVNSALSICSSRVELFQINLREMQLSIWISK